MQKCKKCMKSDHFFFSILAQILLDFFACFSTITIFCSNHFYKGRAIYTHELGGA